MIRSIGSKQELKIFLKNKKFQNILIISGYNSYKKTKADIYFQSIFKDKKIYFYFKKSSVTEYIELINLIKFKESIKPNLIIAVGGGCVLDYAKIISNFKIYHDIKKRLINSDLDLKIRNNTKVLAIPTTAGSGAEVTSNAVLYIDNKKYSIEGDKIKPDFFFLEPKFLQSSSLIIDASAGFDAISQAAESMFSRKSNNQSLNYSVSALKILLKNYKNFIKKKNLNNSYQMALGSNLAGKAINISKTTLPHAMSYPFTIHYGVPHGHAVSLTFNKFLKFNFFNIEKSSCNFSVSKRFELLFKITGTKNIYDLDKFFFNLKKEAFLEQDLKKIGINLDNAKHLSKIMGGINDQRLKNNPIKVKKTDIAFILKEFN